MELRMQYRVQSIRYLHICTIHVLHYWLRFHVVCNTQEMASLAKYIVPLYGAVECRTLSNLDL